MARKKSAGLEVGTVVTIPVDHVVVALPGKDAEQVAQLQRIGDSPLVAVPIGDLTIKPQPEEAVAE